MIAKRLESIVANECRHTNMSHRSQAEMVQRFQKLRDFGMLPKSRGKNSEALSCRDIVAGLFSIVTVKPGFAGLAAKAVLDLRPVGGQEASFEGCDTFGDAVATLLQRSEALRSLVEVRASDSEIATNGYGRGAIVYRDANAIRTAYYVGRNAVSLMQRGREKTYNPRSMISQTFTETIFLPGLFRDIARELARERQYEKALESLGSAREQRSQLSVTP